jgi:hypothetical protein
MYPYNNQSHNDQQFFNIPDEFIIKEKLLTIGTDVKLLKDNQQFGYIKQKMFSFGSFYLENSTGAIIVVAKTKKLTIGRDFEIFDSNNTKIGSIT